jgi:NAD(P)H-hydrate repair Nnr-like enzyme with NAD(P)H-hydrate dehydratase domain
MKAKGLLDPGKMSLIVLAGFVFIAGSATRSEVSLVLTPDKAEANALLDKYIQAFQTRKLALASEVYAHDSDLIVYGSSPSGGSAGARRKNI